ncbi:MAG: TMEM165/GDT1 family protein [Candidatus Krumholzibacteria bacterium]|nr:TMEM165/GDT1 family protein [Candidatus Krumholzibacteria bacterium]
MWKIFFTTFGIMFLAEIGDKTQLAVISCASRFRSPWVVFAGASLALVLATAVGTLVGGTLNSLIGEKAIRFVSGGLFVLFGVLIMIGK